MPSRHRQRPPARLPAGQPLLAPQMCAGLLWHPRVCAHDACGGDAPHGNAHAPCACSCASVATSPARRRSACARCGGECALHDGGERRGSDSGDGLRARACAPLLPVGVERCRSARAAQSGAGRACGDACDSHERSRPRRSLALHRPAAAARPARLHLSAQSRAGHRRPWHASMPPSPEYTVTMQHVGQFTIDGDGGLSLGATVAHARPLGCLRARERRYLLTVL